MSPRSERRHHNGQWLFRRVFDKITLVGAQSPEDADNFRRFGAPRVELTGNLKYDASLARARKDIFSQCTAYTEGFIIRVGANEEQRVFFHILY